MKTAHIAKRFSLHQERFEWWLTSLSGLSFQAHPKGGFDLDDSLSIDSVLAAFQRWDLDDRRRSAKEKALQDEAARQRFVRARAAHDEASLLKQQAVANMLVTSGFGFEGYTITRYADYVSGDDAVSIPREASWLNGGRSNKAGDALMRTVAKARRRALHQLKEAAHALGCNAVIGLDFDYLALAPEPGNLQDTSKATHLPHVFGVTANGNAVVIEKSPSSPLRPG